MLTISRVDRQHTNSSTSCLSSPKRDDVDDNDVDGDDGDDDVDDGDDDVDDNDDEGGRVPGLGGT